MTKRRVGLKVMAGFFAFLAVMAFREAFSALPPPEDDPVLLAILQAVIGVSAVLAAVGSWRGMRWSPWAAIAYGVITGGMVASLGQILDLPAEDQPGLIWGGVWILAMCLACAWYLHRATRLRDAL